MKNSFKRWRERFSALIRSWERLWTFPKPSANVSLSGARPYQAGLENWNRGFFVPAGTTITEQMLAEALSSVNAIATEAAVNATQSVAEKIGFTPEPGEGYSVSRDSKTGRIMSYNTQRWDTIAAGPQAANGIWFFDPQADNPLPDHHEMAMEQMGPAQYLVWICKNYRVDISQTPQSEHQCRQFARIAVRALPDFEGERYHQ